MSKIRDYAVTTEAAAVASSVLEMPAHEAGDLLLVWFNKDTAAGGPATPSGWSVPTVWGANPLNTAGSGNYLFAKRAVSSSEALTLTYTSETSITIVVAIKNVNGTTVNDAFSAATRSAVDDTTLPLDGGSITPAHDNCLVLGLLGTDSGFGPVSLPGWVNLFGGDAGVNSLSVNFTYQKTAAALTHPGYWGASVDDARWALLAIRDSGSELEVPAYLDRGTVPAQIVANLSGVTASDGGTWQAAASVQLLTLAGKTVSGVLIASAADSGYNPYHAAARHIAASSKTLLSASQITFSPVKNMTFGSGVLFGTFRMQLPRDYLDMGKPIHGGAYLRLADASDNNTAWIVAAQASKTTDASNRQNFAIQLAQAVDTSYAKTGTLSQTSINRMFLGGSGYYGACSVEWSKLFLLNESVLAGGSSGFPMGLSDMANAVNNGSGEIPLVVVSGSASNIWTRLKFGGGDPVHCDIALATFQWPRHADEIDYLDFHVDANVMGAEFHGKAGDTLHFTNCVFTSDSSYYWRFNAAHDAGSDCDFSGSTVVNAAITLRSTVSLVGTSFINCTSFTQNNAALTECNFTNTKVTVDNPADISGASFTSSGTGHAIEITTPGTYTFNANTFTGYAGTNGSTGNEAIYNNSGGAVTLNITGGGSTPTIRNGAGATTTVNNAVTLTLTGLVAGSRVYVYNLTDSAQLYNEVEPTTAFTKAINFAGDKSLFFRIRNASGATKYKTFETTGTLTAAGFSLVVNQLLNQ